MAVNKKIPSPSQITKAVSPKDIEEIKNLQNDLNNLHLKFGQLTINKIKLENQENILKKELSSLETQESNIAKVFTDKYGKGSLDIETGEFTPVE
jgi:hypothetical protein|tara:strand:+ start:651 stop:935 length:285 start_codon:yes stop_codon:yes gene_type:complete